MMPLDMATKFFGQPAGLAWLHDGYICDAFRCSHRFRKVTGCDRDSKPLQSLIGNKCYTMFRLVTWFLLPVNRLVAGSNPGEPPKIPSSIQIVAKSAKREPKLTH